MASLNTSFSFFFATFALCQVARRVAKALLPGGTYARFAWEVVGTAQLGACCLEMRTLADVGPWGGGFGPDLLLTPLFLLLLVHGAALDGASADPAVSLQEFLLAEASLPGTLLDLAAQALGMQAACALTRLYWAWELSDMRVLQTLMDVHCGSALRALVEGSCAFLFRLTLLRCRNSLPVYRVLAVALLVTIMAYTGEGLLVEGLQSLGVAISWAPGGDGGQLGWTRCAGLGPRPLSGLSFLAGSVYTPQLSLFIPEGLHLRQKLGAPPQLTLPWVSFLRCTCAGAEEQQRPISSVAAGLGNGAVLSHQIPGIRPRGV
ncbi:aquaporin-12-like [Megaptera novaeangliae]